MAEAKIKCMESKVAVVGENIDPVLLIHLLEFGFSKEHIVVYPDVGSIFSFPCPEFQLVLYQLGNSDATTAMDALCLRFSNAAIIVLTEKINKNKARELLLYGVQDYILDSEYATYRFKRTIKDAINRKQFSNKMETRNGELHNEIQTQKRRLDHILSSINEVVWSCSADTFETIYINDACYDIYGYYPEQIIGNCDLLFGNVHEEDKKHYKLAWRQLLRTGRSVFEYRIFHKDGTIRYIKNEAVLRRDNNDTPRFINGFARDVTLQKKQFFEIQKQNAQLQEIAWIQSHKVRGPVATILGLAQLFNNETADAGNKEIISYLQTATNNLDLVIRDIVGVTNS